MPTGVTHWSNKLQQTSLSVRCELAFKGTICKFWPLEGAHSKQAKKQRCSLMMPWLSVESWELSSSSPTDAIRLIMFMDELMYWRFINTVVWGWGWKPWKRNEAAEVIVWHTARKQRYFYYASTPSGRIWCRISERIRQFKIRSEHRNMRSWISTKRPRITRQEYVINQIPSHESETSHLFHRTAYDINTKITIIKNPNSGRRF